MSTGTTTHEAPGPEAGGGVKAMVTLRHTAPHGLQALETWCLVPLGDVAPDVERWLSEEVPSLVPGGRIEVGVVDELAHLEEML